LKTELLIEHHHQLERHGPHGSLLYEIGNRHKVQNIQVSHLVGSLVEFKSYPLQNDASIQRKGQQRLTWTFLWGS
jgi:hypothetical protein